LGDLPWEKLPVLILLQTRKFFCDRDDCRRRIFTEQLPGTAARYSRRTFRLAEALDWITLAVGGQAGARLARRLGLIVSGATLLRQLRRRARSSRTRAPRVLGMDDWAWKKGHRYGTILCDLETRKVIDLLPDRESQTVAAWLRQHPGTEIVSRDRASAYSEATRKAAPHAVQVADRWHLLRNMSDALKSALEPHRRVLKQAASITRPAITTPPTSSSTPAPTVTRTKQMQEQNRHRRYSRYQQVMELVRRGLSQSDISCQLLVDRRTIRRWTRAEEFPERKPSCRSSAVDEYSDHLNQRVLEGCRNATRLWKELRERGFGGQQSIVRRWLRLHHGPRWQAVVRQPAVPPARTSPRHTAWLMLTASPELGTYLEELYRLSPQIKTLATASQEFFRILRCGDLAAWPQWLQSIQDTALASFGRGLLRDRDAVVAAIRLPWSNGPVEGHVHRLKLIKRQMYGRAGFDLLRLRVLHPA
jgi:transposase